MEKWGGGGNMGEKSREKRRLREQQGAQRAKRGEKRPWWGGGGVELLVDTHPGSALLESGRGDRSAWFLPSKPEKGTLQKHFCCRKFFESAFQQGHAKRNPFSPGGRSSAQDYSYLQLDA